MNIVIVGFGSAGKFYLEILKNFKNINKVYIIDEKKIKLDKSFEQIDAKEIIKRNIKINHAIICTPSGYHYKSAKFFIERKTDVLIEKPFVLKLKHAKELIKLSKKNKVKCWTSENNSSFF